jgi:oxygen-independent coproporphyrinogen-3 oxidase
VAEKNNGLRISDVIDADTAQREALMMGLRLTDGINHQTWRDMFGAELSDSLPTDKIIKLKREGYLFSDGHRTQATSAGLQRLNAVLGYLLG